MSAEAASYVAMRSESSHSPFDTSSRAMNPALAAFYGLPAPGVDGIVDAGYAV